MPLPPQAASQPHNQIPPDRRGSPPDRLSSGVDVGEYIDVAPDPDQITLTPDEQGGAYVDMPGQREEHSPPDEGFYSNLAEVLPAAVKSRIVSDLLRRVEEDREARKRRDEQYEEGIRRTGLGNDAPGGAQFEGASRVVHPMLTEACIDYESRIIKEIFPPSGPVKPNVLGVPTTEKADKAKRVSDHMNYQIRTQIKEARAVLETTLTQTPLGGSQFIRQWWDHRLKRPRWAFVPIDRVYLPFSAADFLSAHRKTYSETITQIEYQQRVAQKVYVDEDLTPPAMLPEESKAEKANQKVQGLDDPGMNLDADREICETQAYLQITEDMVDILGGVEEAGELYPYLITMDAQSNTMLACYRDWEDGDEAREPIEHLYEFPFIPWRGAYSIGFPQMIGGLSGAATGALRALLDSAHVNNSVSAVMLKGSGAGGQTKRPQIGEIVEIDGGLETDDIRKRVMPFPFNPPSSVLFQLLGFLVDAARGVVRTSLDETPMANSNSAVPVGTQMSRVEEGLVVFSAVHGRAHAAMNRLLAGLFRLNRLYLPDELKVDANGQEILVRRKDYEGPCDIQAVSDPTIYSDQQRWAQLNYIQSRAMVAPQLWNIREVELAGLRLIKWPDPEALLVAQPKPHELNQVDENLALALGQPVTVFPEQDHLAHLQVLLDFMKSPMLGQNPLIAPIFLPGALKHAAEHICYYYVTRTVHTVQDAAKVDVNQLMSNDVRVKEELDKLLAQASQSVVPQVQQALQGVMPVIQQAIQMAQQFAPKPPVDPGTAAVEAAKAETARRAQSDQAEHQISTAELASKTQIAQQANAIQADRVAAQREAAQVSAATKIQTTEADNQTALDIASDRLASGQGVGYKNGESLSH